ncbi:protein RICE SALT SENSITIVE 3-like [Pistacia vera]|uniref:protein RICE SALT SENSITIVE 3-like n=1 Tax=Pistacia vera TaxID=55513 RepID=UPI001263BE04|nr:protein RICE SALT SENSITIVE 3-like [Pistacia vera]
MEEYSIDNNPVVATHLLQHTLRNLCHKNSPWIYAVFWRILPRSHPPPDWDLLQKGAHNRSRVNRRNWMLAWEDGFCNFLASTAGRNPPASSSSEDKNCDIQIDGLQPELFFKMSHEIHNYGEGLIGKVAAERGHKCVYSEQINLSVWQNSVHLHPRTWKAQFQSGIKTISLIAVHEGVLQLGALRKVPEDLIYVAEIQIFFNNLQIIPGFLLPRPSSPSPSPIHSTIFPFQVTAPINIHNPFPIEGFNNDSIISTMPDDQCYETSQPVLYPTTPLISNMDYVSDHFNEPLMHTLLAMNSLEKLLMKLPSVAPPSSKSSPPFFQLHDESFPSISPSQHPLMGLDQAVAEDHQFHHEEKACP